MRDSNSVITHAVKNLADDLAVEYDVTPARMYEILGRDNPYPKSKKLIRTIGRLDKSIDKSRVRIIKTDLDAMFCQILGDGAGADVDCAEFHSELSDAVQAKIAGKSTPECLKEFREARAILDKAIENLEREEITRDVFAVHGNGNGLKN